MRPITAVPGASHSAAALLLLLGADVDRHSMPLVSHTPASVGSGPLAIPIRLGRIHLVTPIGRVTLGRRRVNNSRGNRVSRMLRARSSRRLHFGSGRVRDLSDVPSGKYRSGTDSL